MAHADYNCCMICDRKMEYVTYEESLTKEKPCFDCIKKMRDKATRVLLDQSELLGFIKGLAPTEALAFLRSVGYSPCCYDNDIDTYLKEIGLVEGEWTEKRLKGVQS